MIEITNSAIIIRNKSSNVSGDKSYNGLVKKFSIYDEITHSYKNQIYTEIDNDIYLPATISQLTVEKLYPYKTVYKHINKYKITPIEIEMVNKPRSQEQIEAIEFLSNQYNHHKMVCSGTGIGKTFCSISAIAKLKMRTIVFVDTIVLAEQWKNQILEHSNLKDSDIIMISGAKSIEVAKNIDFKIIIAQHMTINGLLSKNQFALNDLMLELGIGIRIFDEAHTNYNNISKILSLSNVEHNIYLTATPGRSQWRESALWKTIFGTIPTYSGIKTDKAGHVQTIMLAYNSNPSVKNIEFCNTKRGFSQDKYASTILKFKFDIYFNTLIKIFNKFKLFDIERKIAIVLPSLNLINKTSEELLKIRPDLDVGILTSDTPKKDRIDTMKKRVFITTEKMFNKGIDISDLEIIINYVPFNSKIIAEQLIGRLRNVTGYAHTMIDVTDVGYEACIKHQISRKSVYKKKSAELTSIQQLL